MEFTDTYSILDNLYDNSNILNLPFLNPLTVDTYEIKTLSELFDWTKNNISYYYNDRSDKMRGVWEWDDVLTNGRGHCFEVANLFKHVADENDIPIELYLVTEANDDIFGAAHTVITVKAGEKVYWLEVNWNGAGGARIYGSLEELFNDVAQKWNWTSDEFNELIFYPADEYAPEGGIVKYIQHFADDSKAVKRFKRQSNLQEAISYLPIKTEDSFKTFKDTAHKTFGNTIIDNYDLGEDGGYMKEIYKDGKLIGYVGFSEYVGSDNDEFNKALGLGNFIILDKGKGLGTEVIRDIVNKYKDTFDLIYCFVDADNAGAIKLYKKLGTVHDEYGPSPKGEYYVVFYDKNKGQLNEVYPNKGESKKDFISRFMSVTKNEYPSLKQRYAVANSYWDRRNK